MSQLKVKMSSPGSRKILRSKEMQEIVQKRVSRIKAKADAGLPSDAEPFNAEVNVGPNRVRGVVMTSDYKNRRYNSKTHAILRAIDA